MGVRQTMQVSGDNVREGASQATKTAIVTGGTGGVGFHAALALASRGFAVLLASRNAVNGALALNRIRSLHPEARVAYEPVDAGDLASVRSFCDRIAQRFTKLDLMINCAGFARLRSDERSVDGFDMQMASNYLGHFAMVGHLLPLLKASPEARVIGVSSVAHFLGSADLRGRNRLPSFPFRAYCNSKLAVLVFAGELQRRFSAHGWTQKSIAAHPGFAQTRIFHGVAEGRSLFSLALRGGVRWLGQPAQQGALPIVHAATAPDAAGGAYYGPDGFLELRGSPAIARSARRAADPVSAQRLWAVSEELTSVEYRF